MSAIGEFGITNGVLCLCLAVAFDAPPLPLRGGMQALHAGFDDELKYNKFETDVGYSKGII